MLSEDTLYLSIRELGNQLRERKLSPVELTESYLARSENLGPKFNAYACMTHELALQQARAAEKEIAAGHYRGPLHGVPYAVKDLVAVRGYPTTWGAKPFANQKFDFDAAAVERLNRAGAVLLGKAAMIELAGGLGYSSGTASLTGGCRNPWNADYWTCGSSSGSGAIVAAGLAPWALGSDTRGSIICPAAWCGVTGMRPSFGRVSRFGAMAIAWSMDKLGPMARSADDCGLVLSIIAGHDPRDFDSLPGGIAEFDCSAPQARSAKRLRIGRLTNVWNSVAAGLVTPVGVVSGTTVNLHGTQSGTPGSLTAGLPATEFTTTVPVQINKATATVTPSQETLLGPEGQFTPVASIDQNVCSPCLMTWTSDNTSVATVDVDTGLVTAVNGGTASISGVLNNKTSQTTSDCQEHYYSVSLPVTVCPLAGTWQGTFSGQTIACAQRDSNGCCIKWGGPKYPSGSISVTFSQNGTSASTVISGLNLTGTDINGNVSLETTLPAYCGTIEVPAGVVGTISSDCSTFSGSYYFDRGRTLAGTFSVQRTTPQP